MGAVVERRLTDEVGLSCVLLAISRRFITPGVQWMSTTA